MAGDEGARDGAELDAKMDALGARWYDRQGQQIRFSEYARLHASRLYRVVAQTNLGIYDVSTIWLGYDHGMGDLIPGESHPLEIFESMIFGPDHTSISEEDDLIGWEQRYATEQEAVRGHQELVRTVAAICYPDFGEEALQRLLGGPGGVQGNGEGAAVADGVDGRGEAAAEQQS